MQLFLRNTESNENFSLTYLPLELEWGDGNNSFASAQIPQVDIGDQPQYWQSGSNPSRSISFTLERDDAIDRLEKLKRWTRAIDGKNAPPICILQVGAIAPVWCVLTGVDAKIPLDRFQNEKPTRIGVSIAYLVVPETAIA